MRYISGIQPSTSNWLGDGELVYQTGIHKGNPFMCNSELQKLRALSKQKQAQQRALQAAEKAAKKASSSGHVTVYDAFQKKYVSATPNEANAILKVNKEIQAQRRASQAAEKAIKNASKSGHVTVYNPLKSLYVSATPEEAKLIKSSVSSNSKGIWGSIKGFLKSSKGKWGLAIAGIVAAAAIILDYVADKSSGKNEPTSTDETSKIYKPALDNDTGDKNATDKTGDKPEKKIKTDSSNETVETQKNDKDSVVVAPVPVVVSEDEETTEDVDETKVKEETEKADETVETEQTAKADDVDKTDNADEDDSAVNLEIHKVVKGDNLWNIAKQNLKDLNKDNKNYEPTNKEILKRTEKLIKINNKEYQQPLPKDSRKRKVLIIPDEEIRLK